MSYPRAHDSFGPIGGEPQRRAEEAEEAADRIVALEQAYTAALAEKDREIASIKADALSLIHDAETVRDAAQAMADLLRAWSYIPEMVRCMFVPGDVRAMVTIWTTIDTDDGVSRLELLAKKMSHV